VLDAMRLRPLCWPAICNKPRATTQARHLSGQPAHSLPAEKSMSSNSKAIAEFLAELVAKNPNEPEFHQAVHEVVQSVYPLVEANQAYREARILDRLVEPERVVMFRVPWLDDQGQIQINRGYRIEMNSAIGPYKGGLRFHPTVTLGILKFLAFEQVLKNSLTSLSMGGGKGGSDFDPKGRSDNEVMHFCQSFMTELYRHIGPDIDVPAGDIGVGGREIGYLFGQYKRIANRFNGVLTGKGLQYGGALLRPEATGYGAVYFAQEMLATRGEGVKGRVAAVSGSGNVAQYTVEKLIHSGAKPITLSDSGGTIVDEDGIDAEKLAWVMDLKNVRRGRISEYANRFPKARFLAGQRPWGVMCDLAFPSATQNEIDESDARTLVANGCICVSEGANRPTTPEGVEVFLAAQILYGPGKAANAGGVSVSGLEMTQNAGVVGWPREEVDMRLQQIMKSIHANCVQYGGQDGFVNYVRGANVAGFVKVADAMLAQGCV
jgi:glutamate dehydrogenase (NADP+)